MPFTFQSAGLAAYAALLAADPTTVTYQRIGSPIGAYAVTGVFGEPRPEDGLQSASYKTFWAPLSAFQEPPLEGDSMQVGADYYSVFRVVPKSDPSVTLIVQLKQRAVGPEISA